MSNKEHKLPKVCDLHLEVYNSPAAEDFGAQVSLEFHGSEEDEACVLAAIFDAFDMDYGEVIRVCALALKMLPEREDDDGED